MTEEAKKPIKLRSLILSILLGGLAAVAFIYGIRHRSLNDFVTYALPIAAVVVVLLVASVIYTWYSDGAKLSGLELFFAVLFIIIAGIVSGAMYYGIGAALKDLYAWISSGSWQKLNRTSFTLIISIAVLTSGGLLFYFRLRLRSIYGLTEAVIGVAIAIYKITTSIPEKAVTSPDFLLAMLTASVYLIVRGLDNIHQGLTKQPLDGLVQLIRLRRQKRITNRETSDSPPVSN